MHEMNVVQSMSWKFLLCLAWIGCAGLVSANPSGEHLYQQNCASCHGTKGDGGVGVPLSLPDFQATISNEYLRKTIKLGRPGRIMPAFTHLNDEDVTAIVQHIRSFAQVKVPKEVTATIMGDADHGKELFSAHCAVCHGRLGEGGKGTGVTLSRPRNFPIMPPALNNAGFLASATDHMIKQTLIKGRRGTPMVSFTDKGLSVSDIDDIVSHIRSFEKMLPNEVVPELEVIISYESPYSMAETIENLKRAAVGMNFRVIRIQTLDNGFVPKDQENLKQTIIYFCNFDFLNQALAIDPRIGIFLPCRITVVESKDKVMVMAINPLRLSTLFNNSELNRFCIEMRDIYVDIMEEAIL